MSLYNSFYLAGMLPWQKWPLSPETSSQNDRYSSKWLIWLACRGNPDDIIVAHLVEVEGGWFEPYDCDVVLVVPEEIGKETEKDSSYFFVHQLLGASLLEGLRGGGTGKHVVTTVNLQCTYVTHRVYNY